MDAYPGGIDPNKLDPRTAAAYAQMMRANQGGGMPAQMPPQMQGPPPVAGQQGGMGGPGPQAPMQAPDAAMGSMGAGGMPPPGQAPSGGGALDPGMVDSIIGLQGQAGQRAGLDRQYKLADALRADSKNQLASHAIGASTGGQMVVAPSWLNGAVAVGQNLMADKRMRDADAAGAGLDKERQGAQRGYFDALTGAKKKKDPTADLGGWGSLSDL
jgi:hypothetical protein